MYGEISQDGMAILLLCADLGRGEGVSHLTDLEFQSLGSALMAGNMRPADLFTKLDSLPEEIPVAAKNNAGRVIPRSRIAELMNRGARLAFMREKWAAQGIGVLCRCDRDLYPEKIRRHLGSVVPAVLYYSGDTELLRKRGIAFVGSRDADDAALSFTRRMAKDACAADFSVVSGGARGVDSAAMLEAFDRGGTSIGVLSSGLSSEIVRPSYRSWIAGGGLLLLSPYAPESRFSAASAMARNKLIYALADAAVVVSAAKGKGGTWSGAVEELRRANSIPVYVRDEPGVSEGNKALLAMGAHPVSTMDDMMKSRSHALRPPMPPSRGSLLDVVSTAASSGRPEESMAVPAAEDCGRQEDLKGMGLQADAAPRKKAGRASAGKAMGKADRPEKKKVQIEVEAVRNLADILHAKYGVPAEEVLSLLAI